MFRDIDNQKVSELAKSIEANGLLQPILVRPVGHSFEVVFGHHRLEACKRLGWRGHPGNGQEYVSRRMFSNELVENLQRNDAMNSLTEAKGYVELIDHGWTINRIAPRIGKSDSFVSDRIGFVRRLHPDVAKRINGDGKGHLKPSHLEHLARLTPKRQLEISDMVERRRLNVQGLERMISAGQPSKVPIEEHDGSLYVRLQQLQFLLG